MASHPQFGVIRADSNYKNKRLHRYDDVEIEWEGNGYCFAKFTGFFVDKTKGIELALVKNYNYYNKNSREYEPLKSIALKYDQDPRSRDGIKWEFVPIMSIARKVLVIPDFDVAERFFLADDIHL